MKKRILSVFLVICLLVSVTGCGAIAGKVKDKIKDKIKDNLPNSSSVEGELVSDEGGEGGDQTISTTRPSLVGSGSKILYDPDIVPSVPTYDPGENLSNVWIADRFKYMFDPTHEYYSNSYDGLIEKLSENSFAVVSGYGDCEFFDIYEGNRYNQFPSFITVDSLMHTYHLYFAYLMKTTEKEKLSERLLSLSKKMLTISEEQYDEVKGTAWEEAALRNVAFFAVGATLQDPSTSVSISDPSLSDMIATELGRVNDAGGIDTSTISGLMEDYSQYKPRGYYDGDEQLEKYFRAMMWYGRMPFAAENDSTLQSAALITSALIQDTEALSDWESIYQVTSFFAGASDDPGYYEFSKILSETYNGYVTAKGLSADDDAFNKFADEVKKLDPPSVNSIPIMEGQNPVIPSFRFMGQRETIDASIMQGLVFSSVKEDSNGNRRMLPDTLDTAAALGSDVAYEILNENGDTGYQYYDEHLDIAKDHFDNSDETVWSASLYSEWLNTLRPLFKEKGEGYPTYMQSKEWAKKDLETFAGSYAELKHDTILYAKQVMAEMGDGDDEEVVDDRGYVDPEPVIYSRFAVLAEKTRDGLANYGLLSPENREDLDKLYDIAVNLIVISEKELESETLTDEEYEFIRCYGGDLEHFWYETNKDNVDGLVYSYQAPCPVVADIATDPNGVCLEVGTGQAENIYVVFPIDGELHLGRGSVYSFYQFEQPLSDRLTDEEWRTRLEGGYLDDNWNWVTNDNKPTQPEWTQSYRHVYTYE